MSTIETNVGQKLVTKLRLKRTGVRSIWAVVCTLGWLWSGSSSDRCLKQSGKTANLNLFKYADTLFQHLLRNVVVRDSGKAGGLSRGMQIGAGKCVQLLDTKQGSCEVGVISQTAKDV